MRILHLTMGNPYKRVGGLNRYCLDLSLAQKKMGHDVDIIYPETFLNSKHPRITRKSDGLYKIFDALPVAITYGIDKPDRYMIKTCSNNFEKWLRHNTPDIIHVHSIQGIHLEFFETAHKMGIPIILTTHDYSPICFRTILVNDKGQLCKDFSAEKCAQCNVNAGLTKRKQQVVQSDLFQIIKTLDSVKKLSKKRSQSTIHTLEEIHYQQEIHNVNSVADLQLYYKKILSCITIIHGNSSVALEQYKQFYPNVKSKIIPITHSGILKQDFHVRKNSTLNISYMGGMSKHKGFDMFMSCLQELRKSNNFEWKAWLYGGDYNVDFKDTRVNFAGMFNKDKEQEVWEKTDVLVVASQWYETFGFIVIEALIRGIPVVCSDLVGSKDIVEAIDNTLIFKHDTISDLHDKIINLMDKDKYEIIQNKIIQASLDFCISSHAAQIIQFYEEIVNDSKN